jgi:hypothetical protein
MAAQIPRPNKPSSSATRSSVTPPPSVLGTVVLRNQLDGSKEFQAPLADGSIAVLKREAAGPSGPMFQLSGELMTQAANACFRLHNNSMPHALGEVKEEAEKGVAANLFFIEKILGIREVSSNGNIDIRISKFLASLSENPLTPIETLSLNTIIPMAILELDKQGALRHLKINAVLLPSPYTITGIVMALQNYRFFSYLIPLDPMVPSNPADMPGVAPHILEECQRALLKFKMSQDPKSAGFQALADMFLPNNEKRRKIEQKKARDMLVSIEKNKGHFKTLMDSIHLSNASVVTFNGPPNESNKINEIIKSNAYHLTSEILQRLEIIFEYYQKQVETNPYYTLETYYMAALTVIYHNIKARAEVGESIIKNKVLLKIDKPARDYFSRFLSVDAQLRNRLVKRLLEFLEEINYGVLIRFRNYIPVKFHPNFDAFGKVVFSDRSLVPINKKYEEFLTTLVDKAKHEMKCLLNETAYDPRLFEATIEAGLNRFLERKRESFEKMHRDLGGLLGPINENSDIRFIINLKIELSLREELLYLFVKIQWLNKERTQAVLEEIKQLMEAKWAAIENKVGLIIREAPPGAATLHVPPSHEDVVKADKKTAKELKQTRKHEKKLAVEAKTAVERQKQHEEAERLKQIAEKKLVKDQLLTAINKLESEDDLACLGDILNNGPTLHHTIDEDVMTKFLKEKLEINTRSTGGGYLFTIGSVTLTFHRSHGRDRAGTLDGGFLKELKDALNGIGITSADIPLSATKKVVLVV